MSRIVQCLGAALLFVSAGAQSAPRTLAELQAEVEQIRVETQQPAIGIALVTQDGPQWVAGLGVRDLATGAAADADTLFRIASVSKVYVGLAVMKLVEQGRLHPDDRLRALAPDLQFQNPWEQDHPILIEHLLEHTTGWDTRPSEYLRSAPDSLSLQAGLADPARVRARTSRWVPGTRHAYSNTGPVVAAYVVEQLTHRRFEDYVRTELFEPLGLRATGYDESAAWQRLGATGYVNGQPVPYAHLYSRPASSIHSSAHDMARLLQLLIGRGTVDGQQILRADSILALETPRSTLGASQGLRSGYGLTLEIYGAQAHGVALYGHGGNLPGSITELVYSPALHAGFVFMLNAQNDAAYRRLYDLLIDYLLQDAPAPSLAEQPLAAADQALPGLYQLVSPQGELLRIKTDLLDVVRIDADRTALTVSPLWGGSTRRYLAGPGTALRSAASGLPALAAVEDPLIGASVQIDSALYQRISAWHYYSRVALWPLLLIATVSSLLVALIAVLRRARIRPMSVRIASAPAGPGLALLGLPLLASLLPNDPAAMALSPITAGLCALSLLYPALALTGGWRLWQTRRAPGARWLYGYALLVTLVHLTFALYLASYGLIGYRSWV